MNGKTEGRFNGKINLFLELMINLMVKVIFEQTGSILRVVDKSNGQRINGPIGLILSNDHCGVNDCREIKKHLFFLPSSKFVMKPLSVFQVKCQ